MQALRGHPRHWTRAQIDKKLLIEVLVGIVVISIGSTTYLGRFGPSFRKIDRMEAISNLHNHDGDDLRFTTREWRYVPRLALVLLVLSISLPRRSNGEFGKCKSLKGLDTGNFDS